MHSQQLFGSAIEYISVRLLGSGDLTKHVQGCEHLVRDLLDDPPALQCNCMYACNQSCI